MGKNRLFILTDSLEISGELQKLGFVTKDCNENDR